MGLKEKSVDVIDRIIEYILYGLIFFIPISKAAIESLFGLALFCFIIKKFLKPDFKFLKSREYIFLLSFVLFCAISIINSGPLVKKSLMALFFKWLEYITIFILFQDTLSHRTRLRNVILIILIAAGIVGIDGLIQKISGIEFLRQRPIGWARNQTYAITGPFNHYNDLGAYLVIILSLAVALLVSGQIKKIYKWVLTTLGILLWLCLLLTFSRGAWLGLISSLFLMLVLSPKNKKWILLCITFITVIIFLIPAARERYLFTFGLGGDADRFAVWQIAFRMIKENPFLGKGIGTFMDYFSIHARGLVVQYAHNCFLQIWAETGIFSLLSFILFIGLILYKGIKAFKERTDFLLFGLICGIFGFLVHSFFDTQFYSLQLATLFWSMLGLLMAVINLKVQNKKI